MTWNYRLVQPGDIRAEDLYFVSADSKIVVPTIITQVTGSSFLYRSADGTVSGEERLDAPRGVIAKMTSAGLEFLVGQKAYPTLMAHQLKSR